MRPGDALAYEVKWFEALDVHPDDPVMGVTPVVRPSEENETENENARRLDAEEYYHEEKETEEEGGEAGGKKSARASFSAYDGDADFRRARAFVALDVETDDGLRLGDTDAVDQNGLRAHASSDLTEAMGSFASADESGWYARRVLFPDAFHGRSLRAWLAVCERDAPARVRAGIRHVRVLREDGEEAYVALASAGTPRA